MAAEARKAYMDFMNGSGKSNNNAQQQQQQQPQQPQYHQQQQYPQQAQWQQPGSNLPNLYAGQAAQMHMQQAQQGLQNPYAGQQYPQASPVSPYDPSSFPPPFIYPIDLSKINTNTTAALAPEHSTNRQQFARVTVPPAAPTPPPAVPQTLASNAALGQHGQLQPYAPQGPPQTIPQHARSQGYVDPPRNYNSNPQAAPSGYYPEWQYNQQAGPQDRYSQPGPPQNQFGYNDASAMAPVQTDQVAYQRGFENTRDRNRVQYNGVWPPPDVVKLPSPPMGSKSIEPLPDVPPLALCHVCSVCGHMRSAGYHRHHPIIPGQALISNPCRRCKKRAKKDRERREKEKERLEDVREPSRSIVIEVRDGEPRGRGREREDSPPRRVVYRSISRPNMRPSESTRVEYHTAREESPERSPPRRVVYRSVSRPNIRHSDSAGVEYHTAREQSPERSPPRYRSVSRPRMRRDSVGVEYRPAREESPERSPPRVARRRTRSEIRYLSRSPSRDGVRVRFRHSEDHEQPRSLSPRSRIATHPSAYRSFTPSMQPPGSFPEEPVLPDPEPLRGILRDHSQFEYSTRHAKDRSYDSMEPEYGGTRVQFAPESRPVGHAREYRTRCVTCRNYECTCEGDYTYVHRTRRHYERGHVEELPSPEPPIQRFEGLRIRDESPPSRSYTRVRPEVRPRETDQDPRYFESDHLPTEEYRQAAPQALPPPREDRGRNRYSREESRRESSPIRRAARSMKELDHRVRRTFSRSPSPRLNPKHEDWDDATDSGTETSGEHYFVRVHGVDENGQPATFIEERVRKPAQTSARAPVRERIHISAGPPHRGFAEGPAISRGFAPQ